MNNSNSNNRQELNSKAVSQDVLDSIQDFDDNRVKFALEASGFGAWDSDEPCSTGDMYGWSVVGYVHLSSRITDSCSK